MKISNFATQKLHPFPFPHFVPFILYEVSDCQTTNCVLIFPAMVHLIFLEGNIALFQSTLYPSIAPYIQYIFRGYRNGQSDEENGRKSKERKEKRT